MEAGFYWELIDDFFSPRSVRSLWWWPCTAPALEEVGYLHFFSGSNDDRNQVNRGDDGVIVEVCTLLSVIVVHCGCCSVSQVLIWSQPVISVCVRRTPGSRWRCVRTPDCNIRGWNVVGRKWTFSQKSFIFLRKIILGKHLIISGRKDFLKRKGFFFFFRKKKICLKIKFFSEIKN